MARFSLEYLGSEAPFLAEYPVTPLLEEQVDQYTPDIIKGIEPFDVIEIRDALREYNGKQVWGVDQGASSLKAVLYTADSGFLYPSPGEVLQVPSNGTGEEFLAFYQNIGAVARHQGIPVGISTAGNVQGTRLLEVPSVDYFKAAFIQSSLHGDFANIIPTLGAVNNDAQAALNFSLLHATRIGLLPEDANGRVVKMEPGHVRLVDPRRHPDQTTPDLPCGFEGNQYVCIENSVGGITAISKRWKYITGEEIGADKVAGRYWNGTPQEREWAGAIYLASASGFAEGIAGMGKVTGLLRGRFSTGLILPINGGGDGGAAVVVDSEVPAGKRGTTIAFHGGVNREPGYDDRVLAKLKMSGLQPSGSFYTEAITKYPGAMGAAIAAVVARRGMSSS